MHSFVFKVLYLPSPQVLRRVSAGFSGKDGAALWWPPAAFVSSVSWTSPSSSRSHFDSKVHLQSVGAVIIAPGSATWFCDWLEPAIQVILRAKAAAACRDVANCCIRRTLWAALPLENQLCVRVFVCARAQESNRVVVYTFTDELH